MTNIRITALTDIGNNIAYSSLVPVVDMAGTPTTKKANLQIVGNLILSGAGGTYFAPAARAILAQSVTNAAQPNITSVGTLTSLAVSGNVNLGSVSNLTITGGSAGQVLSTNGNGVLSWANDVSGNYSNSNVANYLPTFTGNVGAGNVNTTGTVYTSGISSTGLSSLTILNVSTTANLGAVGNVIITGGSAGQKLTTDGAGNLTWTNDANSSYGNSNVVSLMAAFGNNTITTTGNVTANYFNGVASDVAVEAVNNNYSYHMAFVTGAGDTTLHMDADDNLQYNPADGTLTATRVDATYVLADLQFSNGYPAANVTGLGNIATINLTGSNANVLYGNGVFAPAAGGGGNVSELVNGDKSFALQSDGNVVFSEPEGGVNRGLVWDYGAVANGVNSTIRQDINGLSVRAWTENAGNYAAPVNIVTNQDANAKTWAFDGQGNLTVPSGSIKSINDGGQLGAYLTLTPDLGLARLAGRSSEYTENFNSGGWTSASYTGTQVDITDAPNLLGFVSNNTIFTSAVDRTFSINGGEPVPYTGYGASGNNVTLYTDITADPDPTVVTSIDFYYQSESFVAIDYDDGTLNINATGLTINLDNDQTSGPDINLRSGDDITLQAKNKALGSESEGGDININAGAGASDDGQGNTASTGGDIIIDAGDGGDGNTGSGAIGGFTTIRGGIGGFAGVTSPAGSGGYVNIQGGDAGSYAGGNAALGAVGGNVSISAGLTTQEGVNGPNVTITSGQGGPNALAGSVLISTPSSANGPGGLWQFDGAGLLTLPDGAIIDTIGNNFEVRAIENVNFEANAVVNIYTDGSNNAYQWQFGDDGNLTLPGNTFAVNYANGTAVSIGGSGNTGNVTFSNVTVQGDNNGLNLSAGADFTANLAYLQVRAGDVASHIHLDTGNNSAYDLIVGDDQNYVQVSSTGNILLSSYDSNTAQYTWTLDYNGNLILAGGNSVIQSIANSSLDPINPNVSTMVLTPDPGYYSQSLVLDPTAPGHIHLRAPAFSNIDEPAANIFLGGEDTSFEVTYGANNEARIHSGGNDWTFGNDGNLTIPGSSGGFIKTVSNASIGIAAMDNGTNNPAQLLSMNVGTGAATSIVSAYSTNVAIQTNATGAINTWEFDNTGNLTIPGSLIAITASPSPTINGFSITNSMGISGNGNISTAGTITATGKIGYSTGGNATQSSTGAGVTINQLTGLVTLANRTYNAGDLEAFSISCNKVSNDDFVLVQMVDSVNAPSYNVVAYPNFVLANTISVLVKTLENVGADTPILKFMIVKAPIS